MPADRVLLDTNVLLAATDEARAGHRQALTILNTWPADGTALYLSGQILREYLVVATRPVQANGLGLSRQDAIGNVEQLRALTWFLTEDQRVSDRLRGLVRERRVTGKQIHDANVVATMLVHGVATVVTENAGDFARYAPDVSAWSLTA